MKPVPVDLGFIGSGVGGTPTRTGADWTSKEGFLDASAGSGLPPLTLNFAYYKGEGSIACNYEHVTRGVSAMILYRLLTDHVDRGRKVFEHREFRRDRDLFPCPKDAPFEVYLSRLMNAMKKRFTRVHFDRIARGRFSFYFDAGVEVRIAVEESVSMPRR